MLLRIAGRGVPAEGAVLELSVDVQGKTQAVRTPLGQAISSPLATRGYGQIAVGQLEELAPVTELGARKFATHFRVPGKTCSLLMLESQADYDRFAIETGDDTAFVQSNDASTLIHKALLESERTLGDAKEAFLQWFDRLPQASGVAFTFPRGFRKWVEAMPWNSFAVRTAPLAVKRRDRAAMPTSVQEALARHHLDYDLFAGEAERRLRAAGPADALKALSSLVEENPGDAVLARDVGTSAMTWGLATDAYHLFRRVAVARPHEPQTYRALGQTLARLGMNDLALLYFEVGLAGAWAPRFGDFRRILAMDYLDLLRRIQDGKAATTVGPLARARLEDVERQVGIGRADVVVMITWNTDATDVDLHVIEPDGSECFYGNRVTSTGSITQDVTQGYGPEMYVAPRAPTGSYQVRARYYAADQNRTSTRTKVHAVILEDYGTPAQRRTERIVTLERGKDMHGLVTLTRKERKAAVAR